MASRTRKVITGADALRQLYATMLRHRAEIVRIAGDDWRKTVDEISSGGDDLKMVDVWCAIRLRKARRYGVPPKVDLRVGKVALAPMSGESAAGLLAVLDGVNPIVGGISAMCREFGLNPTRLTRIWALGDLGVEGYTALSDALKSRVAKLSTIQTPEQATAEAKARVQARQQHFDEIATAKPPQVRTWRAKGEAKPEVAPQPVVEVVAAGEPITEPVKSAAQAKAIYRAHVTLRSGGTLDVTASEISVDDSGVLLEGEGMSLALNSQAVAEVTIKWEVR